MGSMAVADMTAADVTGPDLVVPKEEPLEDGFTSSSISSPEPDGERGLTAQDAAPVQKRKGGRKPVSPLPFYYQSVVHLCSPRHSILAYHVVTLRASYNTVGGNESRETDEIQIYATSEERKQRNRQAQAAFRERRTEYIKQLENTIKHHEETLQTLQQSHRNAADECLMLRYKNSLLERILLEKGIDVQAELRQKGSPQFSPVRSRPTTGQASPIQRAVMNRHQQSRRHPALVPPLQPVDPMSQAAREGVFSSSPALQPTPPSQSSSPSASKSPGFAMQGGMSSPSSELQAQHLQQHQRPQPPQQPRPFPPRQPFPQPRGGSAHQPLLSPTNSEAPPVIHQAYYPPSFQKHYDQLGKLSHQEYDAQADMVDDYDGDEIETDNFIPNFRLPTSDPNTTTMSLQGQPLLAPSSHPDASTGAGTHTFDAFDPMLDADPFGLTASMHFPTPFGFDQAQGRR